MITPVFDLRPLGVKPFESEQEFLDSSSTIKNLYQYARACRTSPHAALVCTLARACAIVPPNIVIPSFTGDSPASLNFAAITIAESGGGKGVTMTVAKTLVPLPDTVWVGQTASGEAISSVYVQREDDETYTRNGDEEEKRECKKSSLKYKTQNAFFDIREVREFAGNASRVGSTLVPVLVNLLDGTSKIGCTTKSESNTLQVPEYGYRAAIVIGVQPANIRDITNHGGTGLPQRCLWTNVLDPNVPEIRPEKIAPEQWLSFDHTLFNRYAPSDMELNSLLMAGTPEATLMMDNGQHCYKLHELKYPEGVYKAVDENAKQRLKGENVSHTQLLVLKLAGVIALFLQEDKENLLNVTAKNMQQAEWLVRQSAITLQNGLNTYVQTKNAETYKQEYEAKGDEEKEPIIQNAANSIMRKLEKSNGQGVSNRDISRALNVEKRPAISDALAVLIARNAIQEKDGKYYLTK
ncbi:hypothetical protein [Gardnerella pickettii]|uniref:hypothetical protein n=1 Tax=Gardnerella pickettii TaxID=2914924 RepID=UPI0007642CAA|nr:hypothetical protein [Gardnerella pickettii]KXA16827.1 hypothetical protein HMPREF3204_00367 [Gardnerella pickettii]MDF2277678.1 hypothetical protein [Gardnerella pickettii]